MTTPLRDALLERPVGPNLPPRAADPERDFTSKIEVSSNTIDATVNGDLGSVNEGTALKFLEQEGQKPEDWEVTNFRKITYGTPESPRESVKFSFKRRVNQSEAARLAPDLDDLHRAVKRIKRTAPPVALGGAKTVVGVVADPQIGSTGERGGTEATLMRLEASLAEFDRYVRRQKPDEIVLVDAGDSIENFENAAMQERTNDLQLTEMLRVWRRTYWSWIELASSLAPSVKVVSVPSNHCRVRRGKAEVGPPNDDFGIETLTTLADMARLLPDKYGHVEFYAPGQESESVAIPTLGGKVLGFAHGHQATRPEGLVTWLNGQAAGRTPIGLADIVVFGHFHHLRVDTWGDDRWLFIAPTSDNGSAWFRNQSGKESAPGVLAFTVDPQGWSNLHVC